MDPALATNGVNMAEIDPAVMNAGVALSMVFGVIWCFFGYRVFRIVLGMLGFLLGAALAANLAQTYQTQVWVTLAAALLGGVLGALLMAGIYYVGVFALGVLVGMALGVLVSALADWPINEGVLFGVGLLCGVAAVYFQRTIIIAFTALMGAAYFALGMYYFAQQWQTLDYYRHSDELARLFRANPGIVVMWLLVAAAGVVVQYVTTRQQRARARTSVARPTPPREKTDQT